jgi:hypothetical protein
MAKGMSGTRFSRTEDPRSNFEAECEAALVGGRGRYSCSRCLRHDDDVSRTGLNYCNRRVVCKQAMVSTGNKADKSRSVKRIHPLTGE